MDFLEKDLEDMLFNAPQEAIRERGLSQHYFDHIFRQYNLGCYGIADLITIEYHDNTDKKNFDFSLTIYELKKDQINLDTFNQALRYLKGVKVILDRLNITNYHSTIILIGKNIDTSSNSSFAYLPMVKDPRVLLYTYKYDFDGLKLIRHKKHGLPNFDSKKYAPNNIYQFKRRIVESRVLFKELKKMRDSDADLHEN
jgi:hypothetical protein